MSAKQKRGGGGEFKQEDILQAVVIADSFNTRFYPISQEIPRALLPLVNIPLLNYTIEFLCAAGIQEIIVFCCAHAEQIKQHIRKSKWNNTSSPCKITTIVSEDCRSLGDALRDIDAKSMIQSDFVLVNGDVVSNMRITNIIHEHKQRRLKEKTPCMTIVLKEASPIHRSKCSEEDILVTLDKKTNRIIHYQKTKHVMKKFSFPKELFKEYSHIQMRHDLMDCGICICSPLVPALFQDNFDYESREDFVKGILDNEEILGNTIYACVINDEYAARVSNLHMYDAISKDVISRWVYPLVPENNISNDEKSRCVYSRHNIYLNKDVTLARGCVLHENVVIGHGSFIGSNTTITRSVIGENCHIGENVTIEDAYIWNGVIIGDNCCLKVCVVCDKAVVKKSVTISKGCILSYRTVVGPNVTLVEGTKFVSTPSGRENENEIDASLVGVDGKAYIFKVDEDSDVESVDLAHDMWGLTVQSDEDDESSLSGGEGDDSGPGTPPLDEFHMFYNETLDTLQRAVDENISADNIVLEVNSLKHAYGIPIKEVIRLVVKAIIEFPGRNQPDISSEKLLPELKKIMSKCLPVFQNYLRNSESQLDGLLAMEEFCITHIATASNFIKIIHILYDNDIFDEEVIFRWFNMSADSAEDPVAHINIRKKVAPLIKWLKEADEEESSDSS